MNFWSALLAFVVVVALIVALFAACVVYPIGYFMCRAKVKDIGMPYRFELFGGCQVYDNKRWIPLENWRAL